MPWRERQGMLAGDRIVQGRCFGPSAVNLPYNDGGDGAGMQL